MVIWEKGAVTCTAVNCPPSDIEIVIVVDGLVVTRERFSDNDAAAQFAMEKMREYHAF
jgi:hypothetical protein